MAQDKLQQHLPYDLPAEMAVLGSVLRDPQCAAEVAGRLTRDDFYLPRHSQLFALVEVLEQRNPGSCDSVTVAHEVERSGKTEELGGRPYLVELMESVPSGAYLEYHLNIVRDLALRRQLIRAAEQIERSVAGSEADVKDLIDKAEQAIFMVGDRLVQGQVQSAKSLVASQLERILKTDAGPIGLQTGFLDLDERQGFRPGDFVVLAARPSMGKTALALNVLERVAIDHSKAVLMFSLEMPADQLLLRLLSQRSRVRHDALRRGRLDATDRKRVIFAADELSNSRVFLDDSSQPSLAEIRAKARRLKREGNLDLIIVDYLQLMSVRAENRQQEIAIISRNMKALARDLKIPVLALAQLNRSAEKRDDRRPMLSDLRESGSIEQDADMVLLLFREEVYKETDDNRGTAELIVAKNRNGPTGDVALRFAKELMRFESAVREPVF